MTLNPACAATWSATWSTTAQSATAASSPLTAAAALLRTPKASVNSSLHCTPSAGSSLHAQQP